MKGERVGPIVEKWEMPWFVLFCGAHKELIQWAILADSDCICL